MTCKNGKIHFNAGNINGLHIYPHALSDKAHRRLFEMPVFADTIAGGRRQTSVPLTEWPHEFFALRNLVRDSGLVRHCYFFDQVTIWNYPLDAAFGEHWDSRYRWSSHILAVCLGAGCRMTFRMFADGRRQTMCKPPRSVEFGTVKIDRDGDGEKKYWHVEFEMAPGSLYVMSGDARNKFKHAVLKIRETDVERIGGCPAWNEHRRRRVLVFRASKTFGDVQIERLLATPLDDAVRQYWQNERRKANRWRAQVLSAERVAATLTDEQVAAERAKSELILTFLANHRRVQTRFPNQDINWPADVQQPRVTIPLNYALWYSCRLVFDGTQMKKIENPKAMLKRKRIGHDHGEIRKESDSIDSGPSGIEQEEEEERQLQRALELSMQQDRARNDKQLALALQLSEQEHEETERKKLLKKSSVPLSVEQVRKKRLAALESYMKK